MLRPLHLQNFLNSLIYLEFCFYCVWILGSYNFSFFWKCWFFSILQLHDFPLFVMHCKILKVQDGSLNSLSNYFHWNNLPRYGLDIFYHRPRHSHVGRPLQLSSFKGAGINSTFSSQYPIFTSLKIIGVKCMCLLFFIASSNGYSFVIRESSRKMFLFPQVKLGITPCSDNPLWGVELFMQVSFAFQVVESFHFY